KAPAPRSSGSGTRIPDESSPGTSGNGEPRTPGPELRVPDVDGAGAGCYFEAGTALTVAIAGLVPGEAFTHGSSATLLMNVADSSTPRQCMRIIAWVCVSALTFSGLACRTLTSGA